MNIQTITLPTHEAWNSFQQYRAAVKKRYSVEDHTLMQAYKNLAQNRRILSLVSVMRDAGVDNRDRPKFAISRADKKVVWCKVNDDGSAWFASESWPRVNSLTKIVLPANTFSRSTNRERWTRHSAIVPCVPMQYRPATGLQNYHLLWEAEWRNVPADPILLKDLGNNLYVVVAQWDLSPLEKALLEGRR